MRTEYSCAGYVNMDAGLSFLFTRDLYGELSSLTREVAVHKVNVGCSVALDFCQDWKDCSIVSNITKYSILGKSSYYVSRYILFDFQTVCNTESLFNSFSFLQEMLMWVSPSSWKNSVLNSLSNVVKKGTMNLPEINSLNAWALASDICPERIKLCDFVCRFFAPGLNGWRTNLGEKHINCFAHNAAQKTT